MEDNKTNTEEQKPPVDEQKNESGEQIENGNEDGGKIEGEAENKNTNNIEGDQNNNNVEGNQNNNNGDGNQFNSQKDQVFNFNSWVQDNNNKSLIRFGLDTISDSYSFSDKKYSDTLIANHDELKEKRIALIQIPIGAKNDISHQILCEIEAVHRGLDYRLFNDKGLENKKHYGRLLISKFTKQVEGVQNILLIVNVLKEDISALNLYKSLNIGFGFENSINELKEKNIFIFFLNSDTDELDNSELSIISLYKERCVYKIVGPKTSQNKKDEKEEAKTDRLKSYFYSDNSVHQEVLYTITFFQNLDFNRFNQILSFFLEKHQIKVVEEDYKTDKKGFIKIDRKGDTKKVKRVSQKKSLGIWNENADTILEECCLIRKKLPNGSVVVDFENPLYRKEIKLFLNQRRYAFIQHHYSLVDKFGLLFSPNINTKLTRGIILLSTEMILSNPDYYDQNWLWGFVEGLRQFLNRNNEVVVEGNQFTARNIQELFNLLLENSTVADRFYQRFSALLQEIITHPELRRIVNNFLESLVTTTDEYLETILKIVLRLAENLHNTSDFDKYYWLRKIIDFGNGEIRDESKDIINEIYNTFFHPVDEEEWVNSFIAIYKWLPQEEIKPKEYKVSNELATRFMIHFNVASIVSYDNKNYGEWPSSFSIFTFLNVDQLPLLIKSILLKNAKDFFSIPEIHYFSFILFFKGVTESMQESINLYNNGEIYIPYKIEKNEDIFPVLQGDIIEEWIAIVLGIEADASDEKAEAFFHTFIDILFQELEVDVLKKVSKYWRKKTKIYGWAIRESKEPTNKVIKRKWKDYFIKKRDNVLYRILNLLETKELY